MKRTLTAIAATLIAGPALAASHVTTIEFAYPYSHLFDVTYGNL